MSGRPSKPRPPIDSRALVATYERDAVTRRKRAEGMTGAAKEEMLAFAVKFEAKVAKLKEGLS